ncbi:MAG: DUF4348 domain-containing protein [Bacteroidaceae bacterium]|nr:DUF4348 domain-containing protein [Bacteroidaceae bacterium]MBP5731159.1 DUF4348 domain-containing protein [Bacteroidaceae bacterium]
MKKLHLTSSISHLPFHIILLTSSIFLLTACGGGKSGDADGADSLSASAVDSSLLLGDVEDSLMAQTQVSQAADGVFYDFIASFCQNSKYQRKRILFPLRHIVNGDTLTIGEKQWRFSKLHYNSDAYTVFFPDFKSMGLEKDDEVNSVTVQWYNTDEDKASNYNFEKTDGQWMLTSIDEHSIDDDPNSSFVRFYSSFAADPDFQQEHLAETITYDGLDPDNDDEFDAQFVKNHKITATNWSNNLIPLLPSQKFSNIDFGQDLTDNTTERMVSLEAPGSGFTSRLYFRRNGEQWQLYKIENY